MNSVISIHSNSSLPYSSYPPTTQREYTSSLSDVRNMQEYVVSSAGVKFSI